MRFKVMTIRLFAIALPFVEPGTIAGIFLMNELIIHLV
jgi:hypothetical protein